LDAVTSALKGKLPAGLCLSIIGTEGAPLTLFAADGQYGVEIGLLYLRAQLRKATRMAPTVAPHF
jgi:hypothetical protein